MYKGDAEYDTIQRTREAIQIPLIANGDITSIQKTREVLSATGADAVMIGRGTQGDPWLPGVIAAQLNGRSLSRPPIDVQIATMAKLIREIQLFYGEKTGVKMARKHMHGRETICKWAQRGHIYTLLLTQMSSIIDCMN